jgi:hypothetical protein
MPAWVSAELKALQDMSRGIAENTDLKEVKAIRDRAEAARHYAQSNGMGLKTQNQAAEVKLRAERRAGKLLAGLIKRGGDRKSTTHNEHLKLSDLGIDHNQSARWQREAAVPDDVLEEYLAATKEDGKPITASGLLRLKRMLAQKQQQHRQLRQF